MKLRPDCPSIVNRLTIKQLICYNSISYDHIICFVIHNLLSLQRDPTTDVLRPADGVEFADTGHLTHSLPAI